jgi:hypothetical protein
METPSSPESLEKKGFFNKTKHKNRRWSFFEESKS